MDKKEILTKLEEERKKATALYEDRDKLDKKIRKISETVEDLNDQLTEISIDSGKVDWEFLLTPNQGMKAYEECNKQLELFGLKTDGYIPETNQSAVRVMLIKGDESSYEKTLNGLKTILPFIKPLPKNYHEKKSRGYKYISIFEHTLSEYGVYFMLIDDHNFKLLETSYGHTEELKNFSSLEDLIKSVQENYYYNKVSKNREVDEDEDI